jgi:hypothetical protein
MTLTVTGMFCGAGGSSHAVDLSTPEDHGQLSLLGGFRAECQGMCGV